MGTTVVVGAGIAGVRTVQGLIRRGHSDPIVVIGAELHAPYDRPPLSKEVLHGDVPLPALLPTDQEVGANVEWHPGVTALSLDTRLQQLVTSEGLVAYDILVIATGAHARRVSGLPGTVLRTWDDELNLRGRLRQTTSITIIGAGLIGCEVAASARKVGAQVHLVDTLSAPMIRVVGPSLAEVVSDLHRAQGVTLHLSTGVQEVVGGKARLLDGAICPAEVLLHAVGAAPNTAWLADSGLDVVDGVRCDQLGRAQAPNVYAVGDVAAWRGTRNEHWSSAIDQAGVVAAAITGQEISELPLPYWWSDQYDVKFQGVGTINGADEVRIGVWGPARRTVALYGIGGRICGVVGLSAAKAVMGLRGEIAAGTQLDEVAARFGGLCEASGTAPRPAAVRGAPGHLRVAADHRGPA